MKPRYRPWFGLYGMQWVMRSPDYFNPAFVRFPQVLYAPDNAWLRVRKVLAK